MAESTEPVAELTCDECGEAVRVVEFGALEHHDPSRPYGHVARNQARDEQKRHLFDDIKRGAMQRKRWEMERRG